MVVRSRLPRNPQFALASALALAVLAGPGVRGGEPGVTLRGLGVMERVAPRGEGATGVAVRIRAARNETEPFQVVATMPAGWLAATRVTVTELRSEGGATIAPGAVYFVHPVEVTESTEHAALAPGWYPDALVPVRSGEFLGLAASGYALWGEEIVQATFWVDVKVPEAAEAGEYEGKFRLEVEERGVWEIPVGLQVWDFALPERPVLRTAFGISPDLIAEIYEVEPGTYGFNRKFRRFEDLMAEHRIAPDGLRGAGEVLSGARSGRVDFSGPGLPGLGRPGEIYAHFVEKKAVSNVVVPFWPDWPFEDPLGRDREAALRAMGAQVRWLVDQGHGDLVTVDCGAIDEPGSAEDYEEVRAWGRFFDDVESRYGVRLPMFVTEQPWPEEARFGSLEGYVDIWVTHVGDLWRDAHLPGGGFVERRRLAGEAIWLYCAMVQTPREWFDATLSGDKILEGNPPAWMLDFPPLNYRVTSWIAWSHGASGLLYWDTANHQQGRHAWRDAGSQRIGGQIYNGDGFLIYPGLVENWGKDEPVASIRLKWIRESIDDFDYLMLATAVAGEARVREVAGGFCRGVGDWSGDPGRLFAAREGLAGILEGGAARMREEETSREIEP